MQLDPPPAVREIARRLEDAGHEAWAVGGAIRDAVLGRPAGDWDLATDARPDEIQRLFRRTVPIGVEHGTVGVFAPGDDTLYEVTTFRRDVETFGRHAVVEFADTIDEDLARRDFTCNALAYRPSTGALEDPFGGLDDLRAGRLRTVGAPEQRFAEDYLRVLRALRFAGHYALDIAPATWSALRDAVPKLPELSAERIREELWKILSKSRDASPALSLYAEAGVLEVLYPELAALNEDTWQRTLAAVDPLPLTRPLVRVAALLHATRAADAKALMRRLKASNADTERVERLARHRRDELPAEPSDADIRRWLRAVGPELVHDLFRLRIALCRARDPKAGADGAELLRRIHHVRAVLRRHPPLTVAELAIGGRELKELGLEPGPRFGEILRGLLERVLEDPSRNTREALLGIVRREHQ